MELTELILKNNQLINSMLTELKSIKQALSKQQTDVCTSKEALELLGLNNDRYLTYFHRIQLLNRRKGKGFLYFKNECLDLAKSFNNNTLIVPTINQLYKY